METITGSPAMAKVLTTSALALIAAVGAGLQAHAQPQILVPDNDGPWPTFTVTGSDVIVFELERDPLPNTTFEFVSPGPGAPDFAGLEANGMPCDLGPDQGHCSGTWVDLPLSVSGTFQVVGSTGASPQLRVRAESGDTGTWIARALANANASFTFVHTVPDLQVTFPGSVQSGQTGVLLDASMSAAVFKGRPSPPGAEPSVASYSWRQVSGPHVAITILPPGDRASFDGPRVGAPTAVDIEVRIEDGLFEASETVTVRVDVMIPVPPGDLEVD